MADRPKHPAGVNIAIFAKAPIEGFAKTRLIPRLGAAGAARLQALLIERAVRTACEAEVGPVSLWCAPNVEHESFAMMRERYAVTLYEQPAEDLGARMHHTFTVLASRPTLLMGTDCAVMTPQHLAACAEALRGDCDAVFIPVEDGGYILVGLKRPAPALFPPMAWGTTGVMEETRARARTAGLKLAELAPLWDIDVPEDYERALRCGALQQ